MSVLTVGGQPHAGKYAQLSFRLLGADAFPNFSFHPTCQLPKVWEKIKVVDYIWIQVTRILESNKRKHAITSNLRTTGVFFFLMEPHGSFFYYYFFKFKNGHREDLP